MKLEGKSELFRMLAPRGDDWLCSQPGCGEIHRPRGNDLVHRLLNWQDETVVMEVRQTADDIQKLMTEAAEELEQAQAQVADLRERLAAAESKEVCTKPHSDESLEFCQACKIERLRSIALEGAGWAALIKPHPPLAFIAEAEHACGITPGREKVAP